MVSRPGRRNRAQLILLGCIALAFVIISLGLLVNTTIYTESSSQALSNAQVDSATSLDLETRRGTRSLVHRINLGPRDRDEAALQSDVTVTVDNYSVMLADHYARSSAAAIDVEYNGGGSQLGTRVVQKSDGDFYSGFDLDDNVEQQIGWFVINTNVSQTDTGSTNPFELTIENGSEHLDVQIYRNGTTGAGDDNLTINTELSTGQPARNVTCNPRRNRVVFDVVSGQYIADHCAGPDSLHSLSDLDPPYTGISTVRNGDFEGTWEFVTNRSIGSGAVEDDPPPSGFDDCDVSPGPAPEEACRTPAVWTANVTTAFDGEGVSFHRNRNVTIYGGDR